MIEAQPSPMPGRVSYNFQYIFILCFAGSFVQRCEQYAEYDAFICAPEPSNPWITDDVTLWEQDKSLYVSFLSTGLFTP